MLDALRQMRAESKTKTAGDQLRQILDTFEKSAGAEGSNLDQLLKDVIKDKFRDSPGVTDNAQITEQAKQRVAEELGLHEALSKKAEGEEPGAEISVPAPEEGQAAEDMTLEQISEQYGLTPDEFLDFLSEESEDLNEIGAESGPEQAEPEQDEVDAEPEPEDAAEEAEEESEPEEPEEPEQEGGEEETPKEVYEEVAKESALKIAAMKLALGEAEPWRNAGIMRSPGATWLSTPEGRRGLTKVPPPAPAPFSGRGAVSGMGRSTSPVLKRLTRAAKVVLSHDKSALESGTPGWVAPAAVAGGVGLGALGVLGGPRAWRALKGWRAGAAPGAVADVAQAAKAVDVPPMPQKAFGTQVPEGADEAARAAFQAKREAERAAAIRTLGLGEGWTPAQVKQQHRAMIRGAHPDVAGEAATPTAAELNAAYEILKNGSLRSRIKVAMLRRAFGSVEESFQNRAQRLAETGQLRLLNEW